MATLMRRAKRLEQKAHDVEGMTGQLVNFAASMLISLMEGVESLAAEFERYITRVKRDLEQRVAAAHDVSD